MPVNITRWSPDTCGCILEYSWDSSVPVENRVHSPEKIVEACPDHQGHNIEDHHSIVVGESQMKNRVMGHLFDFVPDHHKKPIFNEKGEISSHTYIKEPKWHFDKNRKLHVKMHEEISEKSKNDAQSSIEATISGKVIIE